ncbi:phosphotransferase family protein [Spongisporangium articulatum]|uniref:Phosphotransferase family protein n=1 Tax=Spongisporangium articulatum TaxID=3362603 RepID=A0ABW8AN60_9ACTN
MSEGWLRELAARYGGGDGDRRRTPSGADLLLGARVVVKLHRVGTDRVALTERLIAATASDVLLSPLAPDPEPAPDGRLATVWPRAVVPEPDPDTAPWADAGTLLARLHTAVPPLLPEHAAPQRLLRSLARLDDDRSPAAGTVRQAAGRLPEAALRAEAPGRPHAVVHGDWHLGQLGRLDGGWRLLDVDDVGLGDPAWDLARPAGFWAAGLLPDVDWRAVVDAYRAGGGPAVPARGDPWPALEAVAAAAVVQAAAAGLVHAGRSGTGLEEVDEVLVEACARMLRS